MKLEFTTAQIEELERLARCATDAHVRSRAMAVRAVALGHTRRRVADVLPYSAFSIGQWCRAYAADGACSVWISRAGACGRSARPALRWPR